MYKFIYLFKRWSIRCLLFFVMIEIVFFSDRYTLLGCFYSIYGWLIVCEFIILPKYIFHHPLSSFVVIGYGLCSFYFPLPATLLEGKPITYNMDIPVDVFLHGIFSITIVVLSFLLYVYLYKEFKGASILRKGLIKIGFYKIPNDFQIWSMGFVGIISLLFTFLTGANTSDDVSSGARFIEGFIPFAYAPYYLLFKPMYTNVYGTKKKSTVTLFVVYSIVILLLAFMSNHRATFMKVIMGIGFVYFLGLLLGKLTYKLFTTKNVIAFSFVLYILTGPLADLGTAMVVVRGQKHDVTAKQLIALTLDTYSDEKALQTRRKLLDGVVVNNPLWDEHYLNNIFLNRLCNLKAADINLHHAKRIKNNSKMRDFFADQLLALLPSPVLATLKIKLDKEFITKASYGDYLYYLSTHDKYGLESKRQSQLNGAGLGSFGYWYFLVLLIVMLPFFGILDLLFFFKDKKVYITIPALIIMPMILTFFNYEGISTFIMFMGRGWIQMIVLYIIILKWSSILYYLRKRIS